MVNQNKNRFPCNQNYKPPNQKYNKPELAQYHRLEILPMSCLSFFIKAAFAYCAAKLNVWLIVGAILDLNTHASCYVIQAQNTDHMGLVSTYKPGL